MSALTLARHCPQLIIYVLLADTLELQAEKQSAHSDWVLSVAFSPDGKTIVSGSRDKTIKVWGVRPFMDSEWEEVQGQGTDWDNYPIKFPYWKNTVTGDLEQQKPSGSKCLRFELPRSKSWSAGVSSDTGPSLPTSKHLCALGRYTRAPG